MKRLAPLLILMVALLIGACGDKQTVNPPDIGEPFPAITLQALDGTTLSLEQHRDKLIILHVWATWCPPCRKEMPGLQRLSEKLDPEKFALLGVSVDEDADQVRKFKRSYNVTFARHIDPDRKIAENVLAIKAYPETFLIGRDGTLLRRMVGEHNWDSPSMLELLQNSYAGVETKTGAYW